MRIHIIGVAGTGMGSLAGLLKDLGHDVSGSDVAFHPPMGPALGRWGVRCLHGFNPEHLADNPDLVIIGNVCRRDNVEVLETQRRNLEFTHIAGALERFALSGTAPLVVTGTHGKTTTTSMCAFLLDHAGLAPGFLVGGIPLDFDRSFRAAGERPGRSLPVSGGSVRQPPFVMEGDEYDTAFFEKTAKFLHYKAEVAILTSIEHDHIDIYPSFESYLSQFERFIRELPESGLIIANAADSAVVDLVQAHARASVAYYALDDENTNGMAPHWLGASGPSDASGSSFDLFAGGILVGRMAVPMWGRHNIKNAIAALAACAQGYGARLGALGPALAEFRGVKRRLELLGAPGGVSVYDDFAHHPTAVKATLEGLRKRHPKGCIFVLFEPRSATACRNLHQEEYVGALAAADDVLLAPLGRQNLPDEERLDPVRLAADLRARGTCADSFEGVEQMVEHAKRRAKPGDVVVALSNGAFAGVHDKLLAALG